MSSRMVAMSFNSVWITSVFESIELGISRRRRIKNTTEISKLSKRRVGRYSIIIHATLPPSIIVLSITNLNPDLNPPYRLRIEVVVRSNSGMSKSAMKKFATEMVGRVVVVFLGIGIYMNASVMSNFIDNSNVKSLVETNMELIGMLLSIAACLNIIINWYIAFVEEEEVVKEELMKI